MGSTIDHDGRPSRPPGPTHGGEPQGSDERSIHDEHRSAFSVQRQPLRNERDWSVALGGVTGDDVDSAFADITSDIKRPDTMPNRAPAAVSIQSTSAERDRPTGDRTQQVLEADIQEAIDIADKVEPEAPLPVTPRSAFVSQPPPQPGFSFGTLLAVVVITSTLSAGLGCALTLFALSFPSVQHQLFGRSFDQGAQGPATAGVAPQAALGGLEHDGGISPSLAARVNADASDARDEDRGQGAGEVAHEDGAPPSSMPDAASTVDGGLEPAQEEEVDSGPSRPGVPDQMVLPISFVYGRPRIVQADRTALRSLARSIVSDRRSRYELIGYAAEDEEPDPDRLRQLKARRAVRARDLIRSFGPSSQRFKTRAAGSDEPQPTLEDRDRQHGAVLLLRIID